MTKEPLNRLDVEDRGSLLIARLDGGPLAQLGPGLASALTALVGKVESDPAINAVVLTGTHPGRFTSAAWAGPRCRQNGRRPTDLSLVGHAPGTPPYTRSALAEAIWNKNCDAIDDHSAGRQPHQQGSFRGTAKRRYGVGALLNSTRDDAGRVMA
jgi:hypothetical protein